MGDTIITIGSDDPLYPEPIIQPDKRMGCLPASVAFVCRWFGIDADQETVEAYRASSDTPERLLQDAEWYPVTQGIKQARHTIEKDGIGKRWFLGMDTLSWVVDRLNHGMIALVEIERVRGFRHCVVLVEARPEGGLVMDPLTGYVVDSWDYLLGWGWGKAPFYATNHRIRDWYWSDPEMAW